MHDSATNSGTTNPIERSHEVVSVNSPVQSTDPFIPTLIGSVPELTAFVVSLIVLVTVVRQK